MDFKNTFSIIGIGAMAYWATKAAVNGAMSKVVFTPGQAEVDTTLLTNGILRINWHVSVQNNNPIAVTVNQVAGRVYYGSINIGNVTISDPLQLVPGEVKTTVLRFDVPATTVISDMFNSISQNGWFGSLVNVIRFKGTLYTSVINVPIDTTLSIV